MAIDDFTGISFNYDDSQGIGKYTIVSGGDGHPDTLSRDKGEWQAMTVAHTPLEPLDNLAFYGWQSFGADSTHSSRWFAYPLHAIGDAVAPHHTIGSTGWGHRPYEDAVERSWWSIRYVPGPGDRSFQYIGAPILDPSVDPSTAIGAQIALVANVLRTAYTWRTFVLTWRAAHPGHALDVPVRDLITALARETLAEARSRGNWPFDPVESAEYQLGDAEGAVEHYFGTPEIDYMRATMTRGMAAQVAFLASAVEGL
jgi:hypothetical protein